MQTPAGARNQLLAALAEATDAIGAALSALAAAYEQLDTVNADRLEEELFRPVQLAFGRAGRAHAGFAARHGHPGRRFAQPAAGLPSTGARGFIENAVAAAGRADAVLAELQDSLLPVEVGDQELRAALADLRELVAAVPQRARELLRTLGR